MRTIKKSKKKFIIAVLVGTMIGLGTVQAVYNNLEREDNEVFLNTNGEEIDFPRAAFMYRDFLDMMEDKRIGDIDNNELRSCREAVLEGKNSLMVESDWIAGDLDIFIDGDENSNGYAQIGRYQWEKMPKNQKRDKIEVYMNEPGQFSELKKRSILRYYPNSEDLDLFVEYTGDEWKDCEIENHENSLVIEFPLVPEGIKEQIRNKGYMKYYGFGPLKVYTGKIKTKPMCIVYVPITQGDNNMRFVQTTMKYTHDHGTILKKDKEYCIYERYEIKDKQEE